MVPKVVGSIPIARPRNEIACLVAGYFISDVSHEIELDGRQLPAAVGVFPWRPVQADGKTEILPDKNTRSP